MFNRKLFILVDDGIQSELMAKNLRVNFNIEKSLVGYPNLANIKIYNLSESNRNFIESGGLKVQVFAGYEDTGYPLIFEGNIINVVPRFAQPDWISEIFARDGGKLLDNAVINKAFPAGMSVKNIADELLKEMGGVSKGIMDGLTDCLTGKKSLLRAWQASGSIKSIWDELSKNCGFDWSVNDGVMETFVKNIPADDVPPFIINQASGMIGSPERTDIGVNVKNHLLPELKLGRTIRIESITTLINAGNLFFKKVPPIRNEGVYRIDKLNHIGDTHDNPWSTDISGRIF